MNAEQLNFFPFLRVAISGILIYNLYRKVLLILSRVTL